MLREGQGLRIDVGTNISGAGLVAAGVTFEIGAARASELATWFWQSNSAATAGKMMMDVFNATGSGKILRVRRVAAYQRPSAAVTGTVLALEMYRTSAIGTGAVQSGARLSFPGRPSPPSFPI